MSLAQRTCFQLIALHTPITQNSMPNCNSITMLDQNTKHVFWKYTQQKYMRCFPLGFSDHYMRLLLPNTGKDRKHSRSIQKSFRSAITILWKHLEAVLSSLTRRYSAREGSETWTYSITPSACKCHSAVTVLFQLNRSDRILITTPESWKTVWDQREKICQWTEKAAEA